MSSVYFRIFFVSFFLLFAKNIFSQSSDTTNYDKLFEQARKEAYSGNRDKAREICNKILDKKPDYYDVRMLLAQTYAWDHRYEDARAELKKILDKKPDYYDAQILKARTYPWDHKYAEARTEIKKVLDKKPENKEALSVWLDVEMWSGNNVKALEVVNNALKLFPTDLDFQLKKAKILDRLEMYEEPLAILESMLNQQNQIGGVKTDKPDKLPEDMELEINKMIDDLKLKLMKNGIGINYQFEVFEAVFGPRHLVELEAKRKLNWGTLIGRISYANRFNRNGVMYEMDAYPKIGKGMYVYLNVGISPSVIFPYLRNGFEFYKKLPRSFEGSLGFRYLVFKSKNIKIFTGSIAKYLGNYWFCLRPFITPKGVGVSKSLTLLCRRYFKNADNYITLLIGSGFTPENQYASSADIFQLKSQKAGISFQESIKRNYLLSGGFLVERQELSYNPGSFIMGYLFDLGIKIRF